jgi:GxxExxY protein
MEINAITEEVIGAAIDVHRALGPGLLESAYEACLVHELTLRGLELERQRVFPIVYRGLHLERCFRVDLIVEKRVVVEIKSVERFDSVHDAQILTYLRASGCEVGLLINFNVRQLRLGVRRFVNGFSGPYPDSRK